MPIRLTLLAILFTAASARAIDDVASLRVKLDSKSPEDIVAACKAVATLGPKGAALIPALQVADRRANITRELPTTIGAIGEAAIPELKKLWESNDPRKQEFVLFAAPALGAKAEPLTPLFAEGLRDKKRNDVQVTFVCNALKKLGPAAKGAAPTIIERLNELPTDDMRALELVETLGAIGPAAAAAVPRILTRIDAWKDPPAGYGSARQQALYAAAKIGPTAVPEVIPLLLKPGVTSEVPAAFKWLALVGPAAKDAVDPLRQALKKDDDLVRLGALNALAAIGPAAKDALPDIRPFLKPAADDKNSQTKARVKGSAMQVAAAVAIAKIDADDRESIEILAGQIDAGPLALRAIRDLGPRAKSTLPSLKKFAETLPANDHRAAEIVFALASVGPDGRQTIVDLMKNDKLRHTASQYLGQAGKDYVPQIAAYLKDSNRDLRFAATQTLASLARVPEVAAAVPDLIATLDDKEPLVRLGAIDALGRIGPPAKAAIPKLTALAEQAVPKLDEKATQKDRDEATIVVDRIRFARASLELINRGKN